MIKKVFILLLSLSLYYSVYSQTITNSGFQQKGNSLIVNYQVRGLRVDQTCFVELFASTNGGSTFSGPLKQVSGDAGEVTGNGSKSITWNVFEEVEKFDGSVVFDVRATITKKKLPIQTFISYSFSPNAPYGLMVGRVSRWGYYARAKSNGNFTTNEYTYKNGAISDYTGTGYYEFDGTKKYSTYGVTVGALKRITNKFFLYAGAGYGSKTLLWKAAEFSYVTFEKTNEAWVKNSEKSYQGVEFELGGIVKFRRLLLSFGASSINAEDWDGAVGVGVAF